MLTPGASARLGIEQRPTQQSLDIQQMASNKFSAQIFILLTLVLKVSADVYRGELLKAILDVAACPPKEF